MARIRYRIKLLQMVTATLVVTASGSAAYTQDVFDKFPFAITCKSKGTIHALYLSRVVENGTATYVASDRLGGTITLGGEAKAIGNEAGGNCVGKTLDELRASGQARDLKR